jgi:hypothetical protein
MPKAFPKFWLHPHQSCRYNLCPSRAPMSRRSRHWEQIAHSAQGGHSMKAMSPHRSSYGGWPIAKSRHYPGWNGICRRILRDSARVHRYDTGSTRNTRATSGCSDPLICVRRALQCHRHWHGSFARVATNSSPYGGPTVRIRFPPAGVYCEIPFERRCVDLSRRRV